MSLQSDLDAIAAKQGKSVPPGNVIQGSEGGWPDAALPGERRPPLPEDFGDPDDFDPPPSPMIPRRVGEETDGRRLMPSTTSNAGQANAQEALPEILENFRAPDLTILGNDDAAYIAAYQGRQVELSTVEAAAVRKVVLQAIKRTIMAQLGEVDALLPKRKRKRAGEPPKKRGRPRKVQP